MLACQIRAADAGPEVTADSRFNNDRIGLAMIHDTYNRVDGHLREEDHVSRAEEVQTEISVIEIIRKKGAFRSPMSSPRATVSFHSVPTA